MKPISLSLARTGHCELSLLPAFYLEKDVYLSSDIAEAGWRYAEFRNTGYRYFVRSKGNRRWHSNWTKYVTDFEVRHVETIVRDGAIWAGLGKKHSLRICAPSDSVPNPLP